MYDTKKNRDIKLIEYKTFDSEEITSIEDIFDKNKKKIEREVKKKVEKRIEKAHEKASNSHERVGFEKNNVIPASHSVISAKDGIQEKLQNNIEPVFSY